MYDDFVGQDPRKVPMEIFPSIHYSMGGIWVDREHHTNIPGLMASGECDYQYHGANRLGANSLLSATYSGTISGLWMMFTTNVFSIFRPSFIPLLNRQSRPQRNTSA